MAIIFHNPGVIDMRAVTTFGLSVKESDNPIGFFGTGLKYAVAVLLREGCEIEICAGPNRYEFTSMKDTFRGQECDLIVMDGDDADHLQLPFTLQLGKTWKVWQAYRELYCNALDEGGGVCDKHEGADPRDGYTFIIVRGQKFADVHAQRKAFINDEPALFEHGGVAIVPTPGVYLKGIRIADSIYYKTMYGYRFDGGIDLTEDRTMKFQNQAENKVRDALTRLDDYDFIQGILQAPEGTFEEQIAWGGAGTDVGETFKRALLDLSRNQPNSISSQANELAKRIDKVAAAARDYVPSETQRQAFDKAVEFLNRRGIDVHDYPVKFVETLGENILAKAVGGSIVVSAEIFQHGVKMLVATLYEEHLHLSKGFHDCTRSMQNHLFHAIVGLWEDMEGECL